MFALQVVEASLVLLEDPEAFGRVIMVHVNGRLYEWSPQFRANLRQIRPAASPGKPLFLVTGLHVMSLQAVQWTLVRGSLLHE